MLQQLWRDEQGAVLSSETCVFAVVLVIGIVAGIVTFQNAIIGELADLSDAISAYDFTPTITSDGDMDDMSLNSNSTAPLTFADQQ
jgi:Flp pilus assembly pilin Flp